MVRFAVAGFDGFDFALTAAHLFRCAAAILLRAAGLMVRLPVWPVDAPDVPSLEPSWRLMSTIFSATFRLICSNPINAASSKGVSAVLCPLGMYVGVLLTATVLHIRVAEPIITQRGGTQGFEVRDFDVRVDVFMNRHRVTYVGESADSLRPPLPPRFV
jgi:hypothetical protein